MTLSNLDMTIYTILFVIPGFIMSMTYGVFHPRREGAVQILILRFLLFSVLHYSLWWWFVYKLITVRNLPKEYPLGWGYILIGLTIVSPFLLGFTIAYFSQKEFMYRFFRKIGLNPVHGIPTAWDRYFRRAAWLIVSLKDGTIIHGKYGENSFASHISEERDIYLEQLFSVDKDSGEWRVIPNSLGIWIPAREILFVEFYKGADDGEANEVLLPRSSRKGGTKQWRRIRRR